MSSTQSLTVSTLSSVGNLIKILPTGTVFLFQFLSPLLTNNGECNTTNEYLIGFLLVACAISCCFSSFTDSYVDSDGAIQYGIVTSSGLWPASSTEDLSSYALRVADFVHAFCSLAIFAVVVLLDPNVVQCYYPSFEFNQETLLMALPPLSGVATGGVCSFFPNDRHGIGYPFDLTMVPALASALA